jgi:zinc-binding alcohol dehydrogenase family protein
MKAIAISHSAQNAFVEIDLPAPRPLGRDLLVRVEAISVNPVDTKVRAGHTAAEPRVLGWDAAGVVDSVGPEVTLFRPGDSVYYAGSIGRPGSNAEYQLVDERIVGRRPQNLSVSEAAALPLTAITAWEALFERLHIDRSGAAHRDKSLLLIGAAGGVGSIAIQLAKLAKLKVIATASRDVSAAWVRSFGADHVIDHTKPLRPQLEAAGFDGVDFVANLADTDAYWAAMVDVIRPQGAIVSIVENSGPLDIGLLQDKSATFSWEFMFTRAAFETSDMIEQHRLLNEVANLIERGALRTTVTETLRPISVENLRLAHEKLKSGRTIGKITLQGW